MGDPETELMQIHLKPGDIVNERAEVYVTSVHRSKNLRFGPLASRIYENFGRERLQQNLNDATRSQTELNHGQVVMIRSGDSADTYVIMVCLHAWRNGRTDGLQRAVKNVLEMADRNRFTSMALPALGMGGLKYPPFAVTSAILNAIFVFKQENPSTRLGTITIPLLDKENSIRTFLQNTISFINGHQMTCEAVQCNSMFDLRGVTSFHGLESTRPRSAERGAPPEGNPQQVQVQAQDNPPTYVLSGQCNNISYNVGTSASLRQRRIGVRINVGFDLNQYIPGWLNRILPGETTHS